MERAARAPKLARSLEGLHGTGVVSALQPRQPTLKRCLRLDGWRPKPLETRLAPPRDQGSTAAADHGAYGSDEHRCVDLREG